MFDPETADVHPSGLGAFITPPVGYFYRIWRTPSPKLATYDEETKEFLGDTPVPVLAGFADRYARYLDWGAEPNLGQDGKILPTIYRCEAALTEDGEYVTIWEESLTLTPVLTYSPIQDDLMHSAMDVRSAVIVFFSTRLAELVRSNKLFCKKKRHGLKFPVTPYFDFAPVDLPGLAVEVTSSTAQPFDLGYEMGMEYMELSCNGAALDRAERDGLTNAFRYLARELSWFLEELGCINPVIAEIRNSAEFTEPMTYVTTCTIQLSTYGFGDCIETLWELAPVAHWGTDDKGTRAVVF